MIFCSREDSMVRTRSVRSGSAYCRQICLPEGLAALLREEYRILGDARVVGEGLEDHDHVAHRDLLAQEGLEDLLHLAEVEALGRVLDDGGIVLLEGVEDGLDLLPPEDLRGVPLDDVGEVGGDDARRVDDGIARALGPVALLLGYPERGQAEGRVPRLLAGDVLGDAARVDRQVVARAG